MDIPGGHRVTTPRKTLLFIEGEEENNESNSRN